MSIFNKKGECPDPFADKVKCDECKCWVDKKDAQRVKGWVAYTQLFDFSYCQAHKKPYDSFISSSFSVRYYKEISVDINGEPIGYKKIESKEK